MSDKTKNYFTVDTLHFILFIIKYLDISRY